MRILFRLLLVNIALVSTVIASAVIAQETTFRPVVNVKQLMTAMVVPSSDAIFDVAKEAPKDNKDWAAIRNQIVILAESGNLLMIGERAADRTTWMKMSLALVDAGMVALKAAEAKNVDALIETADQVMAACEACHDQYLDKGSGKQ